ncbi:TonB-dependent receptor [Thalassospira sp. A40-3]|uniref:TonB-dependent receptor domain-containing protein n=1 Tax=Thalassospira sp. A40-3 TaxID=2785908 RepID=UPI0018CF8E23|nr:TonB-dependent receptor [Thalassospira sp. A40-3]QPO12898.1 TonB-dependent receptor [Thalassospira sp. A40-3]
MSRLLGTTTLFATLMIASVPHALAQTASDTAQPVTVAAGDLRTALDQVADQFGLQLVVQGDLSGIESGALTADMSAREALKSLLSGSGYGFEFVSDDSVIIKPLTTTTGDAQGQVILPEVVVTATRSRRSIATMSPSVVVIGPDQIEAQSAKSSDITNVIRNNVPGFMFDDQSLISSTETFRGRDVQVLVDGIARNTPLRNSSRILSMIDIQQVESIEVIPGSNAMNGDGATGATINIITKTGEVGKNVFVLDAHAKSYTDDIGDSFSPSLTLSGSGGFGAVDLAASVTGSKTGNAYDGYGNQVPSDAMLGQGGFDNAEDLNVFGKAGVTLAEGHRLFLSSEVVRFRQDIEYFSDLTTDPVSVNYDNPYNGQPLEEESQYFTGGYEYDLGKIGTGDLKLFYNDSYKQAARAERSRYNTALIALADNPTVVDPLGQSVIDTKKYGAKLSTDTGLDAAYEGLTLTWGGDLTFDDVKYETVGGRNIGAPMEQEGYALFGQLSAPITQYLDLSGGVRYEKYDLTVSDFTRPNYIAGAMTIAAADFTGGSATYSAVTYNASAVVHWTERFDTSLSYSEGFSVPDVGAYTRRAGEPRTSVPLNFANIDVQASKVKTYELAARYDGADFRTTGAVYMSTNDFGNNYDATNNKLSQEKERIIGAELTGEYDISDETYIGALASYVEGRYDTNEDGDLDSWLPNNRIPSPFRFTGYVDSYVWGDLNMRFDGTYTAGRYKIEDAKIKPSLVFNLSGNYPLLGGTARFGIENIFDTSYENPAATALRGYSVAGHGRTVLIGYRREF